MDAMTMWSRIGMRIATAGLLLFATTWATPWTAAAQGLDDPIEMELLAASGLPGDSVEMSVVLHTGDHSVSGIQIDVEASPPLSIAITDAQRPDCWRNTALDKDYTAYSFPFRGEGNWDRMRSLVLSLTNVTAIPDGALLFTCKVDIAADAEPGEYQLVPLRLLGSTSHGEPIAAVGRGGTIIVADATEGSAALDVATGQASGGCAIAPAQRGTASALMLLLPLVLWGFRGPGRLAQPQDNRRSRR